LSLSKLGKYYEALLAYDLAICILNNTNEQNQLSLAAAWNGKGEALLNLNRYDNAIEAFNTSIELQPRYYTYWYNKGVALKSQGRTADAKDAFAKAKELGYTGKSLASNGDLTAN
jgi:tetratricopeptide (TPR) repeat protein